MMPLRGFISPPGKQLTARFQASSTSRPPEREAQAAVRDIDTANVTAWRNGRVFLEDLPLEDAVAEMNKYSATKLRVGDAALGGLRVNGMFMAGEQQAFASALESYFQIATQRRGDRENRSAVPSLESCAGQSSPRPAFLAPAPQKKFCPHDRRVRGPASLFLSSENQTRRTRP